MIVTDLAHMAEQTSLTPALQKALDFLQNTDLSALPDGRTDIDGDKAYALVQSYETREWGEEPLFEAHRQYIDIQYVISGEEVIGWMFGDRLTSTVEYDETKDAWLNRLHAKGMTPVRLSAGQLAVLYPSDAHSPGLAAGAPAPVKKIVVKVAVGS